MIKRATPAAALSFACFISYSEYDMGGFSLWHWLIVFLLLFLLVYLIYFAINYFRRKS